MGFQETDPDSWPRFKTFKDGVLEKIRTNEKYPTIVLEVLAVIAGASKKEIRDMLDINRERQKTNTV